MISPYVPLIFYYPNHSKNGVNGILQALERSIALKKSLSKTLTQFYTLAGSIKDDLSVDCNDVGASFIQALVRGRLDDFLTRPDQKQINRLLPFEPSYAGCTAGDRLTNVQVNIFECGGIAIGLCVSHKILDGAALIMFVKAWANMACGDKEVVYPSLSAPSIFPADKSSWLRDSFTALYGLLFRQGKFVTKRFVFGSDSIARLKSEAVSNGMQQPTRVEVVSALIWKCAMAASKETRGFENPSCLTHLVNLRTKLPESISKDLIGNVIWIATAIQNPNHETPDTTFDSLVKKVHEGISKIDVGFVEKAQGKDGYVAMLESLKETGEAIGGSSAGSLDGYAFTSWCKMGFYEVDFGWGKPRWVAGMVTGDGTGVFMNLVNLIDTGCGEGIEAWVKLDEAEMKVLQNNQELLEFASLDPSPIHG